MCPELQFRFLVSITMKITLHQCLLNNYPIVTILNVNNASIFLAWYENYKFLCVLDIWTQLNAFHKVPALNASHTIFIVSHMPHLLLFLKILILIYIFPTTEKPLVKNRHYNTSGHAHELTYSCYSRTPYFYDPLACRIFLGSVIRAQLKIHLPPLGLCYNAESRSFAYLAVHEENVSLLINAEVFK